MASLFLFIISVCQANEKKTTKMASTRDESMFIVVQVNTKYAVFLCFDCEERTKLKKSVFFLKSKNCVTNLNF